MENTIKTKNAKQKVPIKNSIKIFQKIIYKKMNKKTSLQIIALFLIELTLILPIYSAMVFADLSSIQAKGIDGVNNFIREQDFIAFKATASISGDSQITPNQVVLGSSNNFDTCNAAVNGFECSLRFPSNSTDIFDPRAIPYTINLKNDNGNIVDTKSDNLYVDNLKPTVALFQAQSELIKSGDIEFKFSISDIACDDASCSGKCSGIKKIEFFTLDGKFNETKNIDTASCGITDILAKPTSVFGDGTHSVFARAFDRLNKPSDTISTTFKVDATAPVILANTFKITDSSNFEINFVAPTNAPVLAKVDIRADDLNKSSVIGDFSALGYRDGIKAGCPETIKNITTCTWEINLNSNEAGTKNIRLEASDLAGNKEVVAIPKNFDLDATGPEVKSLKSARAKDDKNFAKPKGNKFIAEFKEDGAGINPEDALLNIENKAIQATNCTPSGVCIWDNVDISSSGKVTVAIKDAKDRLGNALKAAFSIEAIVDVNAPVVSNVSIQSLGDGTSKPIENVIKTGDSLNIVAFVKDDAIESAVADLSGIVSSDPNGTDVKNFPGNCLNTAGNSWQCVFTTPAIDISGFIDSSVFLTFTDIAGNSIQHKIPIKVFGVEGAAVNLWKHSVSCSPKLIDRQTTALIQNKVFCHVHLDPLLQQDIEPLVVSLGTCSGNQSEGIDNSILLNAERGSKDPFIKLNLKKTEFKVNEIALECPLSITSRIGNKVTTSPEVENVPIKIEFFNMPVGELESSVQKKIDDAVEDATENYWELVTGLKKIEFYATKICQIVNIIQNVVALFKGIGFLMATNAEASKATPAYPAVSTYRKFLDVMTEAQREGGLNSFTIVKQSCQFVNCRLTFDTTGTWTGWIGKWQNLGESVINTFDVGQIVSKYVGKDGKIAPASAYMNPKDSMAVAVLTACIPGIIHGLDKYRQIQCMYANCLQEGVGKQGLPVFACEDQKDYATCKYVTGEIFKVIPITAMFDYYLKLIRNTLVNPLSIIGIIPGYVCQSVIPSENNYQYHFCAVAKVIAMVGETAQEVKGIIDEGFKVRDDFCKRLEEKD